MAPPLRVSILTGDFYPEQVGGQGIYAYAIATRAAAAGLRVSVICPEAPGRKAYRYPPGVGVRCLPAAAVNPLLFSLLVARDRRAIAAGADVLHVNELFGFSLALRLPREKYGLVTSSHNSYLDRFHAAAGIKKLRYPPLVALERLSYPRADRVLIGSEIERKPVQQLGVSNEKISLIPYGVERERFEDADGTRRMMVRASLGIPSHAKVVLFVGRFVERKKPQVVAEALKRLRTSDSSVHGILVGDGEMSAAVRQIAGSDPAIHLTGAVPFSELPGYYAAADAFTLPAVGEGSISLVVLEAAAAGLPLVLTADSSGQSVVFEAGRNGELCELDDAQGLATALERALQRRAEYGARSRNLVAEHFSWDSCARLTIRVYEEAATRR